MAKAKARPQESGGIVVPRMEKEVVDVPIVGTSPLRLNRFSDSAREGMRNKDAQKPKAQKGARDPDRECREARYISTEGWDGLPAVAFKCAMVGVCRIVGDLPMSEARRLFKVMGQGYHADGTALVQVIGEPVMREDVTIGQNNCLIYQPMYWPWRAVVRVAFPKNVLSLEKVLHLLESAGEWEGVGCRRPGSKASNSGEYGCFEIDRK